MWNKKGKLIIITAPSGAGKTTLIKKLLRKYDNYKLSVSYTTRKARDGEINGVDYNFLSKDEFLDKKDRDFFAEWAVVHDNYYGTSKKDSYDLINNGNSVIFDVDYQGALNLKKAFEDSYSVFILPPSIRVLKERLLSRDTDSMEVINKRILNAKKEIKFIDRFDYFLVNDDLEMCFLNLCSILEANNFRIDKQNVELNSFVENFLRV